MSEPWYVSERAESIAILRLTDDPENFIVSSEHRGPYDCVVGLSRQKAEWQIVVEVKGLRKPLGKTVNLTLPSTMSDFVKNSTDRPVAVLAVDVESSVMYFAWLRAPVSKPTPKLQVRWSEGKLSANRVQPSELKRHLSAARKYFAEAEKAKTRTT